MRATRKPISRGTPAALCWAGCNLQLRRRACPTPSPHHPPTAPLHRRRPSRRCCQSWSRQRRAVRGAARQQPRHASSLLLPSLAWPAARPGCAHGCPGSRARPRTGHPFPWQWRWRWPPAQAPPSQPPPQARTSCHQRSPAPPLLAQAQVPAHPVAAAQVLLLPCLAPAAPQAAVHWYALLACRGMPPCADPHLWRQGCSHEGVKGVLLLVSGSAPGLRRAALGQGASACAAEGGGGAV